MNMYLKNVAPLVVLLSILALSSCGGDPAENSFVYTNTLVYGETSYNLGQATIYLPPWEESGNFEFIIEVMGPDVDVNSTGTWLGGDGICFGLGFFTASDTVGTRYQGFDGDYETLEAVVYTYGRLYEENANITPGSYFDGTEVNADIHVEFNESNETIRVRGTVEYGEAVLEFNYSGSVLITE
jgi:hypothetical protein